jgi:hypothetical protein
MSAQVGVEHIILRRMNRYALRLIIPQKFWKENNLGAGDHVVWIPEGNDCVRLKFVRTRKVAEEYAEAS